MKFSDKVAIVTGASSGIGADAAKHLASLGAKVSIVGRNAGRLNQVADEIKKCGAKAPLVIVADVTKDAERIINETVNHFGQIDILVNNAGIFSPDNVVEFDVSIFDKIWDTNLRSVIVLTNLAVPHLEKTKGNIVNISSVAGLKAFDAYTSYCISKAGLDQFTKCAALALASKSIRVNAVNPGMIRTPIFEALGITNEKADAFFEEHKNDNLVGRVGTCSDTSAAVAYLASETFVNGILLCVDGGFTCGSNFQIK